MENGNVFPCHEIFDLGTHTMVVELWDLFRHGNVPEQIAITGELFFWNQIVINTNGIKGGLRKKNDD